MNRRSFLAPAILLPLLAFGCAAPPPPPPELDLAITAGADQNPDTSGHPAPVKVFLYQLASSAKFERADVFALTERDKATLGEDMLASEAIVVAPGEARAVKQQLKGVRADLSRSQLALQQRQSQLANAQSQLNHVRASLNGTKTNLQLADREVSRAKHSRAVAEANVRAANERVAA